MWCIARRRLVQQTTIWSSHALRYCATAAGGEPSKVLHVRTYGRTLTEADLLELTKPFGSINKFIHLRMAPNQALMEMQDVSEATNLIKHYSAKTPRIKGQDVFVVYSGHQELKDTETRPSSKVLLVTIRNPLYEITADVLEKVFNKGGDVEKIVIFQRAGLQALIKFNSDDAATKAKASMNGRQIYDGCCDLDIQFSKADDIDVRFNNEHNRDYTNHILPRGDSRTTKTESILGSGGMYCPSVPNLGAPGSVPASGILPPGITGSRYNTVLLVSNINSEKVDENKLFNLFSGYGRVLRIKIFTSKPDQALIQMADGLQAELAQGFLKGTTLYGKVLEINVSKKPSITSDGRDYTESRRNRFSPDFIKHCCPPNRIIHVSNIEPDLEQGELISHLAPHGVIQNVKFFDPSGTSKQALCEFTTVEEATEALACKHLSPLRRSTIRLAFSRFREIK